MIEIRRAIYEASGEGLRDVLKEQASLYMDELLEAEELSAETGIPKAGFDLLLEILSVKGLYEKPGMELFMVGMADDADLLSVNQKSLIYDTMLSNYSGYIGEDFCWTVCDFVARQFSFEQAFAFFEKVMGSAKEDGRRGVYLGLDILFRKAKNEPDKRRQILSLLEAGQKG